ncbi:aspartate 1-decarboxylase [Mycobacterium marinum]|uniref:Aspartate 1-decarboxylase n=2 Tax=Mycobacterium marinum TaxID=1781 RepID=B2HGQ4_MYCMM|nr:aspartate 1-decarboxylase [Mycobacterium marinum]ACC41607.1 aspartate 1-decarboxylase precursor PanD_2 [Mycobacterium marinum M]AXN45120.1 Aspartate 1-decarboxylase precursor [Mycobacterium marinum]AXN50461.1 Aspartate 1-decarboxylase precursor [Mycobacterium marinum]MDC8997028.1 aspartate 1-decarboxylase [Mycobacterium marinum]MDC9007907.1 aspartate 1-decarboxylase [Mycobacterium marinum]
MQRTVLGGKIHRATVTQADLNYVGSITLDADLMAASGIVEGEQVHVLDITNGARLVTYAIAGPGGSGVVGINGAAAHLIAPGDLVIIMSYLIVGEEERCGHSAKVVHVDAVNSIVGLGSDPAQPVPGALAESVSGPISGRDLFGAADAL